MKFKGLFVVAVLAAPLVAFAADTKPPMKGGRAYRND
jgi:hypothetical protein